MEPYYDTPASGNERLASVIVSCMIGPVLLAVAAYFFWLAPTPQIPDASTEPIASAVFRPVPRDALRSDPPLIEVGGFDHRCQSCHDLFRSSEERRDGLFQHTAIRFDHGLNDRCFNCHDPDNRERLVLRNAETIPFADSVALCTQCHGPTFRDWQRGAHGKTLGSWVTGDDRQTRLVCVQCHDPHAPAYRPLAPLPGPNTLRMGKPRQGHDEPHEPHGPLDRFVWRDAHTPEDHGAADAGTTHRSAEP